MLRPLSVPVTAITLAVILLEWAVAITLRVSPAVRCMGNSLPAYNFEEFATFMSN